VIFSNNRTSESKTKIQRMMELGQKEKQKQIGAAGSIHLLRFLVVCSGVAVVRKVNIPYIVCLDDVWLDLFIPSGKIDMAKGESHCFQ